MVSALISTSSAGATTGEVGSSPSDWWKEGGVVSWGGGEGGVVVVLWVGALGDLGRWEGKLAGKAERKVPF